MNDPALEFHRLYVERLRGAADGLAHPTVSTSFRDFLRGIVNVFRQSVDHPPPDHVD